MSVKTQFHHYIPRFILRRWAVDVAQNSDVSKYKKGKNGIKLDHLNVYNLDQGTLELGTETVSGSFGLVDMYKDATHQKNAYHIETSLSVLEQAASNVISKLEEGALTGSVKMLRSEVNTLRKFLFVMFFRNGRQYRRWMCRDLECQTMDKLQKFMADHSLASTRDAYLLTLRHLLDSKHWEVEHNQNIFSVTRDDYKSDKDDYSLVFYAAPPGVEFILSESAFGTCQGVRPPGFQLLFRMANPSLTMPDGHWLICTKMFIVTPRLAVFLRWHLMREQDETLKQGKTMDFMGSPMTRSYFADLPFKHAHVLYDPPLTTESNSQDAFAHLRDSADLEKRLCDRFTFPVITLSDIHARMVNNMVLGNSTERIAFMNIIPLCESVLAYYQDTDITHKVDYVRLIGAHHMPQITVKSEQDRVDDMHGSLQSPSPPLGSPGRAPNSDSPARDMNIGTSSPTKTGEKKCASGVGGTSELIHSPLTGEKRGPFAGSDGSEPTRPSPVIPDAVAVPPSLNVHASPNPATQSTPDTPSSTNKAKKGCDSCVSSEPVSPSADVAAAPEVICPTVHPPNLIRPAQTTPTPPTPTKKRKKKKSGPVAGSDGFEPTRPSPVIPDAISVPPPNVHAHPIPATQTTLNTPSPAHKVKKGSNSRVGNISEQVSPSADVAAASPRVNYPAVHPPSPIRPAQTTPTPPSSAKKRKKKCGLVACGDGSEPTRPPTDIPEAVKVPPSPNIHTSPIPAMQPTPNTFAPSNKVKKGRGSRVGNSSEHASPSANVAVVSPEVNHPTVHPPSPIHPAQTTPTPPTKNQKKKKKKKKCVPVAGSDSSEPTRSSPVIPNAVTVSLSPNIHTSPIPATRPTPNMPSPANKVKKGSGLRVGNSSELVSPPTDMDIASPKVNYPTVHPPNPIRPAQATPTPVASTTIRKKEKKRGLVASGDGSQPTRPSPAILDVAAPPNVHASPIPATQTISGIPSPAKKVKKGRGSRVGSSSELVSPSVNMAVTPPGVNYPTVHPPSLIRSAQATPTPASPTKKRKKKKRGPVPGNDGSEPTRPSPVIPDAVAVAPPPNVHASSIPATQTIPNTPSPANRVKNGHGSHVGDSSEHVSPSADAAAASPEVNYPTPSPSAQKGSSSAKKGKKKRGAGVGGSLGS